MRWSTLEVEREGHLVRLKLNRPEKRNAQTLEMWRELRAVGIELLADHTVRALLLSGNGPSFSAGVDLAVLQGQSAGDPAAKADAADVQQAMTWLRQARFPTVAVVHGHALGAGMELALACDLRILADDAVMSLPEVNFGILPDLGGCVWLPELVGSAKAKELIFLGDKITSEEALRLNLANWVVPRAELESRATALGQRLVAQPPLAMAAAKRAIAAAAPEQVTALALSAAELRTLLATEDFAEAGRAAAARRPGKYQGR